MELEEIKRNKHRHCDEQNGTAVVEEGNDGNEHELFPVENVKGLDSQTAQEAQVQSERCDEAPRQMSEDQLVIWKKTE